MSINVVIDYPDNMSLLEEKAARIMADILLKKLQSKEIESLVKELKEDKNNITW